jgi:hypothetical protein
MHTRKAKAPRSRREFFSFPLPQAMAKLNRQTLNLHKEDASVRAVYAS